ncbi:hypothetical protein SAMN03159382_05402 [Pseudomonas sp. NFACC23-1]|nr:hypothetical protein SAMN03159386_05357 [Pseudomonas sp. NFACC17-2]SEJ93023.1 hypothetical protein SAMN03159382_05402 [Pseudomonas sp. NFACC23-1]SFW75580.1 hypothetical protein SAMN05660640_03266 [Pseudomonas sp. NFACC16-2]
MASKQWPRLTHLFAAGGTQFGPETRFPCDKETICGEGIYPRWAAQQPLNQTTRCVRLISFSFLGLLRSPAGINPLATD